MGYMVEKGPVRMKVDEKVLADGELQKIYEEMGGEGRVGDFLNRVTQVENQDEMTDAESNIWIRLHDTRTIVYKGIGEEREIDAMKYLQDRFESLGGKGLALTFLAMGQDDDQWKWMNADERELWLKLCGLLSRPVKDEQGWRDSFCH
jgi:hypothetical protein